MLLPVAKAAVATRVRQALAILALSMTTNSVGLQQANKSKAVS